MSRSFQRDLEPMVYVNYCERKCAGESKMSEVIRAGCKNRRTWTKPGMLIVIRRPEEPTKRSAQMFVTVYYAEKGDTDAASFQREVNRYWYWHTAVL